MTTTTQPSSAPTQMTEFGTQTTPPKPKPAEDKDVENISEEETEIQPKAKKEGYG